MKGTNTKYFVNKEKGVVVAKLIIPGGFLSPDIEIVGKAKCSPEDTFDEKFGRDLARSRAELKMLTSAYKGATMQIEQIEKTQNEIMVKINKANDFMSKLLSK